MKHIHSFEDFSNSENTNEAANWNKILGKTIKSVLQGTDGEYTYVTLQFTDNTKVTIQAFPSGTGNGIGIEIE